MDRLMWGSTVNAMLYHFRVRILMQGGGSGVGVLGKAIRRGQALGYETILLLKDRCGNTNANLNPLNLHSNHL